MDFNLFFIIIVSNGSLGHYFTHLQLSDGDCELKSPSQGHTAVRANLVGEPGSI